MFIIVFLISLNEASFSIHFNAFYGSLIIHLSGTMNERSQFYKSTVLKVLPV